MSDINATRDSQATPKAIRGGAFWSAIAILLILLLISFVVLGFNLADFAHQDDRELLLKSNMDAELDVFQVSYKNDAGEITIQGADGEKVVAPGSAIDYTVRLRNKDKIAIDYTLIANVEIVNESEVKDLTIPLLFRMIDPDEHYLAGDARTWVDHAALDGIHDNRTIKSNESVEYVFQWNWPFEGGSDELDTYLGTLAAEENIGIKVSFTLRAEANTSIDANGGFWNSGAGTTFVIILFTILLIIAIVLLIIAIIKRKQKEELESGEDL